MPRPPSRSPHQLGMCWMLAGTFPLIVVANVVGTHGLGHAAVLPWPFVGTAAFVSLAAVGQASSRKTITQLLCDVLSTFREWLRGRSNT